MAGPLQIFRNPDVRQGLYPAVLAGSLGREHFARAASAVQAWPDYAPTPLRPLPRLADALGVAEVQLKDESVRFGLGSFKALGGAYAVERLVSSAGRGALTICCATDGNHGRAIAWAARKFGCRCVVFLHEGVSHGRQMAIEQYGAEIVRTPGNYDASVAAAARAASANGWCVVSDTAYPGYSDVPLDIMAGYGVLAGEALAQLVRPPTHVFLQAGVGGLAAAVAAHLWSHLGPARPHVIVVEPEPAACLYESARQGRPVAVGGDLETVMAGLACGEVSLVAWPILQAAASAFVTIEDRLAVAMVRSLAEGDFSAPLVVGESGVAGLAALAAAADRESRSALELDASSRVLCIGTEGDTDPEIFQRLAGTSADEIRRRAGAY